METERKYEIWWTTEDHEILKKIRWEFVQSYFIADTQDFWDMKNSMLWGKFSSWWGTLDE